MSANPAAAPKPTGAPKPIAGRDMLVATGVAILVYAFAIQFVPLLRSEPVTASGKQLVLIGYLAANLAAFGAAISALLLRNPGYSWTDIGVRPADDRWKRKAVLLGLAATPLAFAFGLFLRRTFDLDSPGADFFAPAGFSWIAAATIVLYGGILVPMFEELFFRGLVYSWLRNRLAAVSAIPISALAFAVVHLRIEVMIVAFAMGCLLAWLYERSRSVLPCILLHQTFNTAQLVLVYGAVALAPDRSGLG
ncbi:MAG: CPBP family intramembrane metalloprotease [Rhodospirillaceae bacterium]|nr:CPBP family intramembrane metalloprotease [Rhodospirillaceae bacterium]